MSLKVQVNPDTEVANAVKEALKANDGYCPCEFEKTPDTKCMCKTFREQDTTGFCHCQLYQKVNPENTE